MKERRYTSMLFVVVVVLAAFGCSRTRSGAEARAAADAESVTVERVVDGDTVAVRVGGRREKVRLLGINTPESVKPHTPVQCYAKEASARLKALLPPGVSVRLVRDVEERDRYGRLLAYVYRQPDGLFINLDLMQGGYAQLLTYRPNVAHVDELQGAERDARRAGLGLWGSCPAATSLPP